jgi:hypothetical protein
MSTPQLLYESKIYFSSIYLYILTEEQKRKGEEICAIVPNAAENYNTCPVRNVTFARAAVFLSLLKNSTNYVKS